MVAFTSNVSSSKPPGAAALLLLLLAMAALVLPEAFGQRWNCRELTNQSTPSAKAP